MEGGHMIHMELTRNKDGVTGHTWSWVDTWMGVTRQNGAS